MLHFRPKLELPLRLSSNSRRRRTKRLLIYISSCSFAFSLSLSLCQIVTFRRCKSTRRGSFSSVHSTEIRPQRNYTDLDPRFHFVRLTNSPESQPTFSLRHTVPSSSAPLFLLHLYTQYLFVRGTRVGARGRVFTTVCPRARQATFVITKRSRSLVCARAMAIISRRIRN